MENRLIVKKRDIVQFLLLWFSFIFHESLLVKKHSNIIMIFAFATIFYTLLSYRKTRDKKMYLFLFALLINVVFVRIINSGGIGFSIWLTWTIDIMTIYCAYVIDEDKFFDRYIILITIYSIISIICSIIFWIEPNIWKSISIAYDINNFDFHHRYYGFLPIHVVSLQLDKLTRNCGIFTEPGLYQIPLNTALYFLLLEKDKISLKKNNYYCSLFFITIALITSKTTSGYIGMLAIIIIYVISRNMKNKLKTIFIIGLIGIVIVIDYIANGTESLIYITILRKFFVEGKIDFSLGTGTYRLATIPYAIQIMKENFWGAGYDIYREYFISHGLDLNVYAGMGLVRAFAYYGFIQTSLIYAYLIKNAYNNKKSLTQFALVIFLYINSLLAQTDMFYPALFILFFIKDNKKNINDGEKKNV